MIERDPCRMSVRYAPRVGPQRCGQLESAGLRTVLDLLYWFPRRHIDRNALVPIAMVREGESVGIQGVVEAVKERRTRRGTGILTVLIRDEGGRIEARYFNQPFMKRVVREGDRVVVSGKVKKSYGLHLVPEALDVLPEEGGEAIHASGWVPVYSVPEPLRGRSFGGRAFRGMMRETVAAHAPGVPEILPASVRERRGLMGGGEALLAYHFPESAEDLERARLRLAYEELFLLQVQQALRRHGLRTAGSKFPLKVGRTLDFRIRALFPFALTEAQERVISEIREDLASGCPMNRLLQGDVGAGKTVVAAYALLAAVGRRVQAAIMAPTEILAEQHFRTFSRMLSHSRVRMALLTGGAGAAKRKALAEIQAGEVDLVVGTHAVVQKEVVFRKLGMVVIDEQQKFGVLQRAALRMKGARPHVLVMTATPIPRTLVMSLFGDLDVSVLDQLPPGRRPVRTHFRKPEGRREVIEFLRLKLREGRQGYVVHPLVEESDKLDLSAAVTAADELREVFPEFKVGLLHGRMKGAEKEAVMEAFRKGEINLLVSTVVVEVGVDVPNATVMVIEDAERYGLSQLHQLRGRIGRGEHESTCYVISEKRTARLKAFTSTTDGFKVAEADLKIRGPGEVLGTRQSGLPEFRVADLVADVKLLGWARDDALAIATSDPSLAEGVGPALKQMLEYRYGARLSLATVG